MKDLQKILTVDYYYYLDGSVKVHFKNELTQVETERTYKTESAAKAQVTKKMNSIYRIYG